MRTPVLVRRRYRRWVMTTYIPQQQPNPGQFLRMMMVDPVCGKDLRGGGTSRQPPVTQIDKGTVYFFCSDVCRRRFEHAPQLFRKGQ